MTNKAYLLKDIRSKAIVRDWLADSMEQYGRHSAKTWSDEDALCETFLSSITGQVSTPSGHVCLDRYKLRGRGRAAEEDLLGADGLGLVQIRTAKTRLDGFFLFQAKKSKDQATRLTNAREQCRKMLSHTAASQLVVLMPRCVGMVGAIAVSAAATPNPPLSRLPYAGFPRFVMEQLLRGLMLAPLSALAFTRDPLLAQQIEHVLAITASEEQNGSEARLSALRELTELDLRYAE